MESDKQKGVSVIITFFTPLYIFYISRVRAMNNLGNFKNLKSEKGVSLIITFFIMIIILAVVLSVSVLLYSQVKIIRNIGESVVSLYAADSGIEKVLYYDRKVLPALTGGSTGFAKRGLCSIYGTPSSANACPATSTSGLDSSLYCTPRATYEAPVSLSTDHNGCDLSVCDNCEVSFNTVLDADNGINYYTTAKISKSPDSNSADFEIQSKGTFNNTARQIQISITETPPVDAIRVESPCAAPKSTSNSKGNSVAITAHIIETVHNLAIANAMATIYKLDSSGNYHAVPNGGPHKLNLLADACDSNTLSDGCWEYDWPVNSGTSVQDYAVDIEVQDNGVVPNDVLVKDIWWYPACIGVSQ